MAIATRSSLLAIKQETTEGTPVAPSANTDFIRMQDDADFTLAKETLQSTELNGSLGSSKSISGIDSPTASFSHYLKHSGVEGQEPGYGLLLEMAFGGKDVEAVEYDTVAGSTVSAINVDTGEGASFIRGQALLIKDPVNGYSIRPVHSIAGDVLTLGFDLASAPGSGVNLGNKSVTYYPTNTGHKTASLWHFVGNGGAIEMISGARVTDTSITATAGDFINASFSLEGISNYYNPIIIGATDTKFDWTDDDGTFVATITAKTYKDPHDLASALQRLRRA